MTQVKYFMAVDLGATSGRTILGSLQNGKLEQEELTRFANPIIQLGRHFYWDIYALYNEIVRGLKTAADRRVELTSVGIDTWGVDFVCLRGGSQPSAPSNAGACFAGCIHRPGGEK